MTQLEKNFVQLICRELEILDGTSFEYFCKYIFQLIIDEEIIHKGHNLYAKPVGYTADFSSDNYQYIGQCGTSKRYFVSLNKPLTDIETAIKNHPQSANIYLFANQRGSGGQLSGLDEQIKKKHFRQKIHVYDSERVSNSMLQKIHASHILEGALSYLPISFEYYKVLPQSNKIPDFASKYFKRDEEETISALLEKKGIIQIYGLSGIGKSELCKSLALKAQSDFETIVWVDGDLKENNLLNFDSIRVLKFDSNINLKNILANYKVLVILDNFNENIPQIAARFASLNTKGSRLLITSLQRNLPPDIVFELRFTTKEVAKSILYACNSKPPEDIVEHILTIIDGYPLILRLITSVVSAGDYAWQDIKHETDNLTEFVDDSRNEKLSFRIIKRISSQILYELSWLKVLGSGKISASFLQDALKKTGIVNLEKRSIVSKIDWQYYTIHKLVLDSIISVIDVVDEVQFSSGPLLEYLQRENEIKSVGYFNFIFNHQDFLKQVYYSASKSDTLKKNILYALTQSSDIDRTDWFFDEIKGLQLDYNATIDLILKIEEIEKRLYQDKQNRSEQDYKRLCIDQIEFLKSINTAIQNEKAVLNLKHHLGKLYARIKDYDKALQLFDDVLTTDTKTDYALLQKARVYVSRDELESAEPILQTILSEENNWNEKPLSVLLAAYELISQNKLSGIRSKYIDNNMDRFVVVLLTALSINFDQPFTLLAKLSRFLSYKHKEHFEELCEKMPVPADIESNKHTMLAYATIQASLYRSLKYSNLRLSNKNKLMDAAFALSEKYFLALGTIKDYDKGKLIDLYIDAGEFIKAYEICNKCEEKNDPFFYQRMCKIFINLEKPTEAIKFIDQALKNASSEERFRIYVPAFLHDKAMALRKAGDDKCISVLKEAIELQNNAKSKKSWLKKLGLWNQ